MAQDERISGLVDPAVHTELAGLITDLKAADEQIIRNIANVDLFNERLRNSRGISAIQTNAAAAANGVNNLSRSLDQSRVIQERVTQTQQRSAEATGRQELAFNRLRAAAENDNREFVLLTQRLAALDRAAQDAGARFGTTSQQFLQARDAANSVRTQIQAINQPLGNFRDQVGQYTNGIATFFSNAFSRIRFLANILPNFGIGTFFLVAGRGIAYVIEQLGIFDAAAKNYLRTAKEISNANVKGAQDAQTELVSLRELYKASQDRTLSLSERKKAVDEIQKQYPDYFKNIKDETILAGGAKTQYDLLTNSILATAKARASEELLAENSKRQLLNEQKRTETTRILLDLNKQLARSKQEDARAISSESAATQGAAVNFQISRQGLILKDIAKTKKTISDIDTDNFVVNQRNAALEKNIADLVKKNGVTILFPKKDQEDNTRVKKVKDNSKQILDEQLKQQKLIEDAVLNDSKSSFDQRLEAVDKFEKNSLALITAAENKKVITVQNSNLRTKGIENDAAQDRQKIAAAELAALEKTYNAQIGAAQKRDKELLNSLKESSSGRLSQIEQDKNAALNSIIDQYTSGKINEREYNAQLFQIEQDALKDRTDEQIRYYRQIIDLKKEAGQDATAEQVELDKIEADRDKNLYEIKKKNLNDYKAALKELKDLEKQLVSSLFDLGKTIGDNTFTVRLNNIQKEKDAITDNTQAQIDAVNRSVASEQVKADKIAVINAQAKAKQDELDQQTRKVKHDQAEFDKLADLAKAASAIALAEVQALTYLSNPFTAPLYPGIAAFIATVGAVQLATIAAREIPAYEKGTNHSKSGLALVGEKGIERVEEPGGRVWYTPEKPTLVSLVGGSKITNNKELMQEMARPPQFGNIMASLDLNGVIVAQKQVGKDIVAAIKSGRSGSTRTGVIHRNTKYYNGYLKN